MKFILLMVLINGKIITLFDASTIEYKTLEISIYHYLYLQNDSVAQLVEHPDFIGRTQNEKNKIDKKMTL